MKLALGYDPNALDLARTLKEVVETLGHECVDLGGEDPVYANTAILVAEMVVRKECDRGILICGTGIGMSIAANKVPGAYAALVSDAYSAERAMKSNNSNIICLGAFTIGVEVVKMLVKVWLENEFTWGSRSDQKVLRYMEYDRSREKG